MMESFFNVLNSMFAVPHPATRNRKNDLSFEIQLRQLCLGDIEAFLMFKQYFLHSRAAAIRLFFVSKRETLCLKWKRVYIIVRS